MRSKSLRAKFDDIDTVLGCVGPTVERTYGQERRIGTTGFDIDGNVGRWFDTHGSAECSSIERPGHGHYDWCRTPDVTRSIWRRDRDDLICADGKCMRNVRPEESAHTVASRRRYGDAILLVWFVDGAPERYRRGVEPLLGVCNRWRDLQHRGAQWDKEGTLGDHLLVEAHHRNALAGHIGAHRSR